jgi:hypothetical protein
MSSGGAQETGDRVCVQVSEAWVLGLLAAGAGELRVGDGAVVPGAPELAAGAVRFGAQVAHELASSDRLWVRPLPPA